MSTYPSINPPTYLSPIQGTETETETDYFVYSKLFRQIKDRRLVQDLYRLGNRNPPDFDKYDYLLPYSRRQKAKLIKALGKQAADTLVTLLLPRHILTMLLLPRHTLVTLLLPRHTLVMLLLPGHRLATLLLLTRH